MAIITDRSVLFISFDYISIVTVNNQNITFSKTIMANLELTRKRFKIALKSVETDSLVQQSVKSTLAILYEYLSQRQNSFEVAEAEIIDKVSISEFKSAISQKLSIKQFLSYFQKVQKIVEKVENYSMNSQSAMEETVEKRLKVYSGEMSDILEQYYEGMKGQFGEELRQKQLKNMQNNINDLRQQLNAIKESKFKFEKAYATDQQQISQALQRIANQQAGSKQIGQTDKAIMVLDEIKNIQIYCSETHECIKELIEELQLESKNKRRKGLQAIDSNNLHERSSSNQEKQVSMRHYDKEYVKAKDLDIILNHLQQTLVTSFQLKRPANSNLQEQTKWIWHYKPSYTHVKLNRINKSHSFEESICTAKSGIYKLIVGCLRSEAHYGCIQILSDENQLSSIELEEEQNLNQCLSRTIMLYAYLNAGSKISIRAKCNKVVEGFLQMQSFS